MMRAAVQSQRDSDVESSSPGSGCAMRFQLVTVRIYILRKWGSLPQTPALAKAMPAAPSVGARPSATSTSKLPAALGLSFIRLATAGKEALGRWGQPPPQPRLPLRSACLVTVSLPRATKRLAGRGCRPNNPAFSCDWLTFQTVRYRGQSDARQVGAAAPKPSLSAAPGLPLDGSLT
jgi:hypothetical protein